jgi:8-oxo-dGTP diphosphatase
MHYFGVRHEDRSYTPRAAAYAVILDRSGRVAYVDETSGLFLPGGGLEPGETPLEAVTREVGEECGRLFHPEAELGAAVQYFTAADGRSFELQASFFLGSFGVATGTPPETVLHWWAAGPEPPPLYHECHRWIVRDVLQRIAPSGRS